jgi:hypothetical protein
VNFSKVFWYSTIAVLLIVNLVVGEEIANKYIKKITGYASFEAGEIVSGLSAVAAPDPEIRRVWIETGFVGLGIEADVNERLRILIAAEAQPVISFRRSEGIMNDEYTESRQPRTVLAIKRGEGIFTLGEADHPKLQLETGFFPYQYNHEARNLGEYMFRTYCYPPSMVNQFDKPYADLVGIRIGNTFAIGPGYFHHDLLLTTSTTFWPFMNWSPSYLFDYSVPRLLTVGGGIQLWNLISVGVNNSEIGSDLTNPDPSKSTDMKGQKLSFAGTKLTGRFTFDFKGFFSSEGLFGKEDLKLYAEAAILGVKDYPDTNSDITNNVGYNDLRERLPIMVGINLPAFKLIDLLNFEIEYQESPYPNSVLDPIYAVVPTHARQQSHARLKWSIYAKKDLGPHVSLIYQMARDHLMPLSTVNASKFSDYTDVLLRAKDWWWTGKVWFGF